MRRMPLRGWVVIAAFVLGAAVGTGGIHGWAHHSAPTDAERVAPQALPPSILPVAVGGESKRLGLGQGTSTRLNVWLLVLIAGFPPGFGLLRLLAARRRAIKVDVPVLVIRLHQSVGLRAPPPFQLI